MGRRTIFTVPPRSVAAALLCGVLAASTTAVALATDRETREAEGIRFQVARDADYEVWFSPFRNEEEIGAYLIIVNHGEDPVEVFPERIRAKAIKAAGKGVRAKNLRVYHAEQYRRLLRRRGHTRGSVGAGPVPTMTAPGPNRQAPRAQAVPVPDTPPYIRSRTTRSTGGQGPTKWVSVEPGRFGDSYIPIGDPGGRPLLRPQSIEGGASCSGLVYMKFREADSYHIEVPLAGSGFGFDFELP